MGALHAQADVRGAVVEDLSRLARVASFRLRSLTSGVSFERLVAASVGARAPCDARGKSEMRVGSLVQQAGYAFLPTHTPNVSTIDVARAMGTVTSIPGLPDVQRLV